MFKNALFTEVFSPSPAGTMKRGDPRLQRLILRIMAVVSLPVLPAVFAPGFTVEKLSWLLGFGQPPEAPLLFYVTAGGSFVYLFLSAVLWMISCDVARYRPLVIFTAGMSVMAAPLYWWIGTHTGMPGWWVWMDALTCLIAGGALLWASGPAESMLQTKP